MGSGRAIKKKFKVAVIHVIHGKQLSYQLHQRVGLIFHLKTIYQELHFHAFCKIKVIHKYFYYYILYIVV